MNKKINKLLTSMLLVLPLIGLSSCNNKKEEEEYIKPETFDLSGFSCNINAASNIGIIAGNSSLKKNLAAGDEEVTNNKLVISNDINNTNETIDMEFEKIIPDVKKSEISRVKEILAYSDEDIEDDENDESEDEVLNATISFKVLENFKYSLYYSEDSTSPMVGYEDIQDGSNLDINDKENYVTLENLEHNHMYYLHFTGKGSVLKYLQNECGYEVEHIYSTHGFTFVSFVEEGHSNRHNYLEYCPFRDDEKYYEYFDVRNYETIGEYKKSYIIDNKTGLIYLIDGFRINSFQDGLLFINTPEDKGFYEDTQKLCDFNINDKDELVIEQLYTNNDIRVINGFKDKYGNKFVTNYTMNYYDEKTNTTFYTVNANNENNYGYFMTTDYETVRIQYETPFNYSDPNKFIKEVKILNENNEYIDIPLDKEFKIKFSSINDVYNNKCYPVSYKDGFLYYVDNLSENYGNGLFGRMNVKTKTQEYINKQYDKDYLYNIGFIEQGYLLIYTDNNLYLVDDLWTNLEDYDKKKKLYIETCELESNLVLQIDINGSIKYNIYPEKDENGNYQMIKKAYGGYKEFVNIVFQPINK